MKFGVFAVCFVLGTQIVSAAFVIPADILQTYNSVLPQIGGPQMLGLLQVIAEAVEKNERLGAFSELSKNQAKIARGIAFHGFRQGLQAAGSGVVNEIKSFLMFPKSEEIQLLTQLINMTKTYIQNMPLYLPPLPSLESLSASTNSEVSSSILTPSLEALT